jgi:predicted nucleic acid-binding protein
VQEKVVIDTNVYIGIFNHGLYRKEIDGFNKVVYLAHPVLHELWLGAKGKAEIKHLMVFGGMFVKLGRLIQPEPSTQLLIGKVCRKLHAAGKLEPKEPRMYNDVCIALLARQVGATVVTRDTADFEKIRRAIDFRFRKATEH